MPQRLPVDKFQQAHVHRLPIDIDGQQLLGVVGAYHAGHTDCAVAGQVLQSRVLGHQLAGRIRPVADFQHVTPFVGFKQKVTILLAAQRFQRAAQAVMLRKQLQRLLNAHCGARQTGAADERGERH